MGLELDAVLASLTTYGVVVTKLVDAVRNTLGKSGKADREVRPWVWQVVAFAFGLAMALIWGINVFGTGSGNGLADGVGGQALTGLAIGAAGSGWHEVLDALSGVAKAGHGSATRAAASREVVPPSP